MMKSAGAEGCACCGLPTLCSATRSVRPADGGLAEERGGGGGMCMLAMVCKLSVMVVISDIG